MQNAAQNSALATELAWTSYPSLTQPRGEKRAGTWAEYVAEREAAGHLRCARKESPKLYGLHTLKPGATRSNVGVETFYGLTLDLDEGSPEQVEGVFAALSDFAFLAYTTYSSSADQEKWRIDIPLAEPVSASAWPVLWRALTRKFAPFADKQTKDIARQYYVPSTHFVATPVMLSNEGRALSTKDLKSVEAVPTVMAVTTNGGRALSLDVLTKIAKKWKASGTGRTIDLGDRLLRVCEGVSYAAEGERDQATFSLCGSIVSEFPDVDAPLLADHFRRSLAVMGPDAPTLTNVIDKIRRCQQRGVQIEIDANSDLEARIRLARGDGKSDVYDEDTLCYMSHKLHIQRNELDRHWIICAGSDYYVLAPGPEYLLTKREAIQTVAWTLLAPVDHVDLTGDDQKAKDVSTLCRDYSTIVDTVVRSLTDKHPRFEGRTLFLPTCPLRDLKPEANDEIAEWLRIIGGDQHKELLQWLSLVTRLETPLPALVMIGEPGGGKTLMAKGLARLWSTDGPTPIDVALGNFNDAVERCPLILGDESLPKDFKGNVRTEELRRLIQENTHKSNRKNRAICDMKGCVRVVVAANNSKILDMREHLTRQDLDAIAQRLFALHVTSESVEYLKSIGGQEKIDGQWINGDRFARHVLSLKSNAPITERFGFKHDSKTLSDILAVRSGPRAKVCEWLVKGLEDGFRKTNLGDKLLVLDGTVMVHVSAIASAWGTYLPDYRVPDTSTMSESLEGLSEGKADMGDYALYVIKSTMLGAWAAEHGYCTRERVRALLREHST